MIFELTFTLRKVATNLAVSLLPNPLIVNSVDPELKENLSADNDSVEPSVLIKI